MDAFTADLRLAFRLLTKQRMFTLLAVLCLALGIGANTAIFTVVNAVLLRPLNFPDGDRLVFVGSTQPPAPELGSTSLPNFVDWRAQSRTMELGSYGSAAYSFSGGEAPVRVRGAMVSSNLFHVLGLAPAIGRGFLSEEELPERGHEVILGYGFWKRTFGGDRSIIGRTVRLDATDYRVIGVMGPGVASPPMQGDPADLWTPMTLAGDSTFEQSRGAYYISTIGRLRAGHTVKQANAEISAIATRQEKLYPAYNGGINAGARSLHDELMGDTRPALLVLAGAVCFLLLIACANVANLMLARVTVRGKEVAVRTALGASRTRIVRQLLTESVILALVGGVLGILLAWWAKDLLLAHAPRALPRLAVVTLDGRVVAFTLALSVLTGLLFGLAPALQVTRNDLYAALKEGGRAVTGPRSGKRLRGALVVAEMSLSLMLLAGAGLLAGSFLKLTGVDPGFTSHDVLTARVGLPRNTYESNVRTSEFYNTLMDRIRALPGVSSVGAVTVLPMSGSNMVFGFNLDGETPPQPNAFIHAAPYDAVTPGYFATMHIPLKAGRTFTPHDDSASAPVAIVNEAFVRRFFPGQNPIGKHLSMAVNNAEMSEIVGVVGDIRRGALEQPPEPTMYQPEGQAWFRQMFIVAKTQGHPAAFSKALLAELGALDKDLAASTVRPLDDIIGDSLAARRFSMFLLATFAVVALSLAAVGIFGVMTSVVTQRAREIAVRVALGAQSRDVMRLVIEQGTALAGLGIALGLVGSFALSRVMRGLLFGIGATDPLTLLGVSTLLASVAVLACWLPARRATRVDPVVVLKDE